MTLSLKPVLGKVTVAFFIFASLGLLLMSKMHESYARGARMTIADGVAPVVEALAKPGDAISGISSWMGEFFLAARAEPDDQGTERTSHAMAGSRHRAAIGERQIAQPDALRASRQARLYLGAHRRRHRQPLFALGAIISSGADQNVQEDLAVINDSGLVAVSSRSARKPHACCCSRHQTRAFPSSSETSRERAIAAAMGNDALSAAVPAEGSKIKVGEKVVTSGDGGVLPRACRWASSPALRRACRW